MPANKQPSNRNTHIQVYAVALELCNRVLAEESVKEAVNALLVASSHKARQAMHASSPSAARRALIPLVNTHITHLPSLSKQHTLTRPPQSSDNNQRTQVLEDPEVAEHSKTFVAEVRASIHTCIICVSYATFPSVTPTNPVPISERRGERTSSFLTIQPHTAKSTTHQNKQVVADDSLQRTGGAAIWSSFQYSFQPKLVRVCVCVCM